MPTYKQNPIIDNGIALRLLWMLCTPFKENPLYKSGTIDENGKYILSKSERTKPEQRPTYLDRLIINIKKLLLKLPGGESQLKNIISAMILIKEGLETENAKYLTESIEMPSEECISEYTEQFKEIWREYLREKARRSCGKICEDGEGATVTSAPTTTSSVSGFDAPLNFHRVIRHRKAQLSESETTHKYIDAVRRELEQNPIHERTIILYTLISDVLEKHGIGFSAPNCGAVGIQTDKFTIIHRNYFDGFRVTIHTDITPLKTDLVESLRFNRFGIESLISDSIECRLALH